MRFTEPRRIEATDDLTSFNCGVMLIDEWLINRAHSAEKQGTAVAYLSFEEESQKLAGFYSLSTYALRRDEIQSGWLRRNVPELVPTILLGMLGVDSRYCHNNLGRDLVRDAFLRAVSAARIVGARALIVDPIDGRAARFYEKCGFDHLDANERMYLRIAPIERYLPHHSA